MLAEYAAEAMTAARKSGITGRLVSGHFSQGICIHSFTIRLAIAAQESLSAAAAMRICVAVRDVGMASPS